MTKQRAIVFLIAPLIVADFNACSATARGARTNSNGEAISTTAPRPTATYLSRWRLSRSLSRLRLRERLLSLDLSLSLGLGRTDNPSAQRASTNLSQVLTHATSVDFRETNTRAFLSETSSLRRLMKTNGYTNLENRWIPQL